MLIDSGSTKNFMDTEVKGADGRCLTSTGQCSNTKMFVQDYAVITDLFLLPLDKIVAT